METRVRILLLSALLAASGALGGCASLRNWLDRDTPKEETQDEAAQAESDDADEAPPRVIEPEVARRKIKVPKIDTENFEIGGVFGALSVEEQVRAALRRAA